MKTIFWDMCFGCILAMIFPFIVVGYMARFVWGGLYSGFMLVEEMLCYRENELS